jgi:hypothetical protein
MLLAIAMAFGLPAWARLPKPAAYCMDARQMQEVKQADARTLAIWLDDGARYRLELADECPAAAVAGSAALVARDGWVCGANDEYVRDGDRQCVVAGLAPIDAEQYARLARQADRAGGIPTLDAVSVKANANPPRRFTGSPSYCLDSRHMRGWRDDGDGVIVEMAPRRTGGIRYYRVELATSCPELSSATSLTLQSGMGITAICGNPGDKVVFGSDTPEGVFMERPDEYGIASRFGCAISLVYPMETAQAP